MRRKGEDMGANSRVGRIPGRKVGKQMCVAEGTWARCSKDEEEVINLRKKGKTSAAWMVLV